MSAIKIIIVLLLGYIIVNLFRALFIMLKNDPNDGQMSRFLGRRVAISACVLIIVIVCLKLGLIRPNPDPVKGRTQTQISTATPHLQSASTKPRLETQSVAQNQNAL